MKVTPEKTFVMNEAPNRKDEKDAIQGRGSLKTFPKEKPLRIPRRFMLGGLKVEVLKDDTMIPQKGMVAESRYNEQEISYDSVHARPAFTEQAFWHEKVHWALFVMNEDNLRNNEKFVDTLAHFLYQAEITAEYGDEKPEPAVNVYSVRAGLIEAMKQSNPDEMRRIIQDVLFSLPEL